VTARTLPLDARLQRYVLEHGARETAAQRELRRITQHMPQSSMQIGAEQGALMQMLVRVMGARRCLEIGTFTGYSALAVALALPPAGRLLCCDVSEEWTAIARRYW
jgi:O-methyltransferase